MALTKEQKEIVETMYAGTDCFGTSLVETGMTLEEVFNRLNELEEKLTAKAPICPHCLAEMKKTFFKGYYDERSFWACECDFEKDKEAFRDTGCYA